LTSHKSETSLTASPINVRSIAMIALFAASALALTPIRIPTFYLPGLTYTFSAIPIVIAFLLFGPKIGILTGTLLVAGQLLVFPIGPPGLLVYPMGFAAVLLMFAGIYLASLFISRKDSSGSPIKKGKQMILLTASAIALRAGIMPFFTYIFFTGFVFPLFLASTIPGSYFVVFALLYNVTSTLYTVPVACVVARKVSEPLGIEMHMFR
jgi:thiamine transporter ThiT